jgi:hypothetical protein
MKNKIPLFCIFSMNVTYSESKVCIANLYLHSKEQKLNSGYSNEIAASATI